MKLKCVRRELWPLTEELAGMRKGKSHIAQYFLSQKVGVKEYTTLDDTVRSFKVQFSDPSLIS